MYSIFYLSICTRVFAKVSRTSESERIDKEEI